MSNIIIVFLSLLVFDHYGIEIEHNVVIVITTAALIIDGCRTIQFLFGGK